MLGKSAHDLAGKKLLWTGTNGFLGRWVLRVISQLNREVLATPCHLMAVDLAVPSREERDSVNDDAHIDYRAQDLTVQMGAMGAPFHYVVHMAGIASPHHYKKKPLETIDVALEGSRGALEIAKRDGARYLFCSSSEVYQTASVNPTPETYVGAIPSDNSRSCYDVSKLMGETFSHVYHTQFNTNTGSIRIFNSMGPGLAERDHRILPRIASSIVRRTKLQVFSNGVLPSRTYCPVANTVAGMFLALLRGRPDEIYNIGMDKPELTVVQLIERIERVMGLAIDWELVSAPEVYATEPLRRCPDISKARRELRARGDSRRRNSGVFRVGDSRIREGTDLSTGACHSLAQRGDRFGTESEEHQDCRRDVFGLERMGHGGKPQVAPPARAFPVPAEQVAQEVVLSRQRRLARLPKIPEVSRENSFDRGYAGPEMRRDMVFARVGVDDGKRLVDKVEVEVP